MQGRTILSSLICRVGHFSVTCFAGSDNSQSGHSSVKIFQSIAVFVIKLLYKLKNDAEIVFDVNAYIALCVIKNTIQDWYQLNDFDALLEHIHLMVVLLVILTNISV